MKTLKEIAVELEDICIVEAAPGIEGRTMTMVLSPGKPKAKPAAQPKPVAEDEKKPEVKTEEKAAVAETVKE